MRAFYHTNRTSFKFKYHCYNIRFRCYRGHYEAESSILLEDQYVGPSEFQAYLQQFARKKSISEGRICHGLIIKSGLQNAIKTSNILMHMYSKCGFTKFARQVFDRMPQRCIVSWNTMMSAYTQHAEEEEAFKLFIELKREGISPSEFTLSSILCACASKSALIWCQQLHAFSLKSSMNSNIFVSTAVLDVYAKSNFIKDARTVFDNMKEKSDVTWSSMISGYVQNDMHEKALIVFLKSQKMAVEHSPFTLSAVLCACANLASLIEGKQVHGILMRTGINSNLYVSSSLIDMYAKCGGIEEAYAVFSIAKKKNLVLWNAMIAGLARHACSMEAMILFEKMQQAGLKPNEITYTSLLSACSHVGLVGQGWSYFNLMNRDHGIDPNVHHYGCMVDILGRVGQIHQAHDLIQEMPFEPTASIWGSLLGSCRIHGDLELAESAAKSLFEIEPNNGGNHVLLSNVYASKLRWEDVRNVRKYLKESGAIKETAKSWIEVKNRVHTFVVGERNHPRMDEIYEKLEELTNEMKKLNYRSVTSFDLHYVEDYQKEKLLRDHSEKLALAFGLIAVPYDTPIIIKKNLRICGDCHSVMKFTSRITKRLIVVRDTYRFHHFKDGACSCQDFW